MNNDEILDLVNENDEVIGEVTKSNAHINPELIHREVSIILVDKNKKILLQKRAMTKKSNPGVWCLTAGHIGKGENIESAAHRELKEELGFDTKLHFIKKERHSSERESRFFYVFIGLYNGERMKLQKEEVDSVSLYSKDDILILNSDKTIGSITFLFCQEFFEGKIKYED